MDNDIVFLLQKILLGQAKIEERLDEIQRTINPQRWERLNPEFDDGNDEIGPPF